MSLTLCLVTKGRIEFLGSLLNSLSLSLRSKEVDILILLNGVEDDIAERFNDFMNLHSDQVSIRKFEKNDARCSNWWYILKEIKTEWIAFPSDDDVINHRFFENFRSFSASYVDYGAVATNVRLINEEGMSLRKTRIPEFDSLWSTTTAVARGLHKCPFLWPGLIIRRNLLPDVVPNSRYALDWWLGIYLILTTKIALSQDIMVNYRVHQSQESYLAPLNRKNLEALICFDQLLESDVFTRWVSALDESETLHFLDQVERFPPIYGDLKYSSTLVLKLSSVIREFHVTESIESRLVFLQAKFFQVLIDHGEGKYFSASSPILTTSSKPNFSVKVLPNSCIRLQSLAESYRDGLKDFEFQIYCKHSNKISRGNALKLDCESISGNRDYLDSMVVRLQELLEISGIDRPSVTSNEFKLIRLSRQFKNLLPAWFRRLFIRATKSIDGR